LLFEGAIASFYNKDMILLEVEKNMTETVVLQISEALYQRLAIALKAYP